jgi:hypothetical protein
MSDKSGTTTSVLAASPLFVVWRREWRDPRGRRRRWFRPPFLGLGPAGGDDGAANTQSVDRTFRMDAAGARSTCRMSYRRAIAPCQIPLLRLLTSHPGRSCRSNPSSDLTDACPWPLVPRLFRLAAVRRRVCQFARAIDHARALSLPPGLKVATWSAAPPIPVRGDNESPSNGETGSGSRFASVHWSFTMKS